MSNEQLSPPQRNAEIADIVDFNELGAPVRPDGAMMSASNAEAIHANQDQIRALQSELDEQEPVRAIDPRHIATDHNPQPTTKRRAVVASRDTAPDQTTHERSRTKLFVDEHGRKFDSRDELSHAQDLRHNWSEVQRYNYNGEPIKSAEPGDKVVQLRNNEDGRTTIITEDKARHYGVIDDDGQARVVTGPFRYAGAERKDGIKPGDKVESIENPDGSRDIRRAPRGAGPVPSTKPKSDKAPKPADAASEAGATTPTDPEDKGDGLDSVRALERAAQDSLDLIERQRQAAERRGETTTSATSASGQGGTDSRRRSPSASEAGAETGALDQQIEQILQGVRGAAVEASQQLASLAAAVANNTNDPQRRAKLLKLKSAHNQVAGMMETDTAPADASTEQLTEDDEQQISRIAKFNNGLRRFLRNPVLTTQQATERARHTVENLIEDFKDEETSGKRKALIVTQLGGYTLLAAAGVGAIAFGVNRALKDGDSETARGLTDAITSHDLATQNIADNAQYAAESAGRLDLIDAAREAAEAGREAGDIAPEIQDKIDAARAAAEAAANNPEVLIDNGHGYTQEIVDLANEVGGKVEDSKDLYKRAIDKFGSQLFEKTPSYVMPNGEYGISAPGIDTWRPEVREWLVSQFK